VVLQVAAGAKQPVTYAKNPLDPTKKWQTSFTDGQSYPRVFPLIQPSAFVKAGGFLGKKNIQMSEQEIRAAIADEVASLGLRPINGPAATATYFYSSTDINAYGIVPGSVIKVAPVTNAGAKIK
jgi:hypothetical protein